MKADSLKIAKVFATGGDVHYFLPYFQREYAWEKENWQTLLNDILSLYDNYSEEKELEHFMGALVVINDGTRNGVVPAFKLVDGQQRLTTISLMLCALARIVRENNPTLFRRLRRLLVNAEEEGNLGYKLLPTKKYGDRQAYLNLLSDESLTASDSKIPAAFDFFFRELNTRISNGKIDPERLFVVITNFLQVVFIDLDQEERPYEIFESLNAKGKPLSQADLVRNYIAMRLPEKRQETVFEKYWSQVEELLQEQRIVGASRMGELTAFLRHYLAFRNKTLCNKDHVYARFRDRIEQDFKTPETFEQEIIALNTFAKYYDRILRPEHEPDKDIRMALQRLNVLEISTASPFLMAAYDAVSQEKLTKQDFLEGLRILENFLVRRYIAGIPSNQLNKIFPILWNEIVLNQFPQSLASALVARNYPSDKNLRQAVMSEPIYDRRSQIREKICLILETINRRLSQGSGGYTALDNYATIEHIMPQTLSEEWQTDIGQNWQQVYEDFIDTLGNLTLVTQEWNSEMSNKPFMIKKAKLAQHELRLNKDYFSQPILFWNAEAIEQRAEYISNQMINIWPSLGESASREKTSGLAPISLEILGNTFSVQSWRDVAEKTAECVAQLSENFDMIAENMPAYFSRQKFQRAACRQLSNGWWLQLNLSAKSIKAFCRNLILAAGLSEEDWNVEEE